MWNTDTATMGCYLTYQNQPQISYFLHPSNHFMRKEYQTPVMPAVSPPQVHISESSWCFRIVRRVFFIHQGRFCGSLEKWTMSQTKPSWVENMPQKLWSASLSIQRIPLCSPNPCPVGRGFAPWTPPKNYPHFRPPEPCILPSVRGSIVCSRKTGALKEPIYTGLWGTRHGLSVQGMAVTMCDNMVVWMAT